MKMQNMNNLWLVCDLLMRDGKELTPCLWRGHQLRGAAGIQRQPLGCNRLQSAEEWSDGPPGPGSSRSEGCKVAATHTERQRVDGEERGQHKTF